MEPTDAEILCDVEKMPCSGATCLMLGAQVCVPSKRAMAVILELWVRLSCILL